MSAVTNLDDYRKAAPDLRTPWGILGFGTERDMLLDELSDLAARIKDGKTTATAVAALSKRKAEILTAIKDMDAGESGEDDFLDDSDPEPWDAASE